MNSEKLIKEIEAEESEIKELRTKFKELEAKDLEIKEIKDKIQYLKICIAYKERELKRAGNAKRYLAERDFIRKTLKIEDTDSNIYVIFDKYGKLEGTKDTRDFSNGLNGLNNWLVENNLYSHCSTDFNSKDEQWYSKSLLEQLETLNWKVEDGKPINLENYKLER